MRIHIGEKLKERADELRMGPTELAKLVSTSKQNIYGIYKRESIDCSLLQKFCKALSYDFFTYYINIKLLPHTDPVYRKTKAYPSTENDTLNNQFNDLKEKYELLKKVNTLLEEKKKK